MPCTHGSILVLTRHCGQLTTNEEAALGQYSPRLGEKAPSLKPAAPEESKIHLMAPTQYLGALSKCAVELETQVSRLPRFDPTGFCERTW